jgi:hypothetical protein
LEVEWYHIGGPGFNPQHYKREGGRGTRRGGGRRRKESIVYSLVRLYMPVIPALRRLWQNVGEFKANLGYIVRP